MTDRKPVAEMSDGELHDLLGQLTGDDMRRMLTRLAGASPEAFDRAVAPYAPGPDTPVPCLPVLHVHTFDAGGQCTQCPVTLTGWKQAAVEGPGEPEMCHYCDVEPATEGEYCGECAPFVHLATGTTEPGERM